VEFFWVNRVEPIGDLVFMPRSWFRAVPVVAVATLLAAGCGGSTRTMQGIEGGRVSDESAGLAPSDRAPRPGGQYFGIRHSVSLGLEDIANPDTDWRGVERNLDAAGVNMVQLSAGRVEFTAFDWPAHPEAAAEPGRDHLRVAIRALRRDAAGRERAIDITVDTLVPAWIKRDPSIAGVDASGKRAQEWPSASALYDGPVGDRIVEYVGEIARRYEPDQITLTELMFGDQTFGADDLRLYRRMTGRRDWPRTASGDIDESDPSIGTWRSRVLGQVLDRARAEVRRVERSSGHRILVAVDVRVNWGDPGAGRPDSGDDYNILAKAADRLVLWAYIGTEGKGPKDIRRVTRALDEDFPIATSRFAVSIGLWGPNDSTVRVVSPARMAAAVRAGQTNAVAAVNVTPMSLMNPAHWRALRRVWGSR
jgi:hypothetical protein